MTNFPTSLDSLPNPTGSDLMENATAALDHDVQHSNANDAIEALEAKVGINGSAVTTTHDYKLSGVTGSDKAVSKTGTETLTNKTLTAPQINMGSDATGDMYYRNGSAATTRLPIGTTGQILEAQASGIPAWVANPAATNASTTAKGVSEEATLAETLARTGTGTTGARTFVSPENLTTVQTYDYAADAGGTDAYAITVTPAPTAYVTGQVFRFKANTANTGTATLNVNSLGALTLKKPSASGYTALETGDILASQLVEVMYNGTDMIVTSTLSSALSSTSLYFPQTLGLTTTGVTTVVRGVNTATSETDGSLLFTVNIVSNTQAIVERFAKDSSGAYYKTHSATTTVPAASNFNSNTATMGLVVIGSYVYLCYRSIVSGVVRRFDKADLTNDTAMTISGTDFNSADYCPAYTNGTDLIICNSMTTWYRYTISGTTITNAATVTTLTGINIQGVLSDGTNAYFIEATNAISKYSFTGTLSTSITRDLGTIFASGASQALTIFNSGQFYLVKGGIVESNTTQAARVVNLIPIARF